MSLSFHSIILATVVAATVAVASAALHVGAGNIVSGKADRLPLFAGSASSGAEK